MKRKYTKKAHTYTQEDVQKIVAAALDLERHTRAAAEEAKKRQAEKDAAFEKTYADLKRTVQESEYKKLSKDMTIRLTQLQEKVYLALIAGNPGLYQNTNLPKIAFNKACDLCKSSVAEQESGEWKEKVGFPTSIEETFEAEPLAPTPECKGGPCDCE